MVGEIYVYIHMYLDLYYKVIRTYHSLLGILRRERERVCVCVYVCVR